jgi:hypothetical protein
MKWAWDKKQAVEKAQQQRIQQHVKQTASGIAASKSKNQTKSHQTKSCQAKSHRQAAESLHHKDRNPTGTASSASGIAALNRQNNQQNRIVRPQNMQRDGRGAR